MACSLQGERRKTGDTFSVGTLLPSRCSKTELSGSPQVTLPGEGGGVTLTKALGTDHHLSCGDTGADGVWLPLLPQDPPQPLCWAVAAWGGGDVPTLQPLHPLLPSPFAAGPSTSPPPTQTLQMLSVVGWTRALGQPGGQLPT